MADAQTTLLATLAGAGPASADNPPAAAGADPGPSSSTGDPPAWRQALDAERQRNERHAQQIQGSREELARLRSEREADRAKVLQLEAALNQLLAPADPGPTSPASLAEAARRAFEQGDYAAFDAVMAHRDTAVQAAAVAAATAHTKAEEDARWQTFTTNQDRQTALQQLAARYPTLLSDATQAAAVGAVYQQMLNDPLNKQFYPVQAGDPQTADLNGTLVNLPLLYKAIEVQTARQGHQAGGTTPTLPGSTGRPPSETTPRWLFTEKELAHMATLCGPNKPFATLDEYCSKRWEAKAFTDKKQERLALHKRGQWVG